MSKLGRELSQVLIVDNSPASYIFHPDNAVSIELSFLRASQSREKRLLENQAVLYLLIDWTNMVIIVWLIQCK